jgi:hypothetical protein
MLKHPITRLLAAVVALAAVVLFVRAPHRAPPAATSGGMVTASAPVVSTGAAGGGTGAAANTNKDRGGTSAHPEIGFHSRERLNEHFHRHGAEFGAATPEDYLRLAQALRDRPAGGDVLEARRGDRVTTRFDRASGAFLAYDDDRTIRTFFRPNDGERYFQRQLEREH